MSIIGATIALLERAPIPDIILRLGVRLLVRRTRLRLQASPPDVNTTFADAMDRFPIAVHTDEANTQHYEVPAAFFALVLGPRRKYSSCYYPTTTTTLAEAEVMALAETVAHADIVDGHRILELGCGWGSLSLYMAERYPRAQITAVSNSQSQRTHIEAVAKQNGLTNLTVITADMNDLALATRFDRIVSVEMFEHMSNWRTLLARVRGWLAPEGRLFLHVFSHRTSPYRFDLADKDDWIAQHFFTGGIMPSHGLIRSFAESFVVEAEWQWPGWHYRQTAEAWLANLDAKRDEVDAVLRDTYGAEAGLWRTRWRLFFLATSGLFADSDGTEWGVSHYRLKAAPNG